MPSQLFFTSLIVQATAAAFLLLVFLEIYAHSGQRYLAYWTAGWFSLAGGLAARLMDAMRPAGADGTWSMAPIYHVSLGVTAVFALFACLSFRRDRLHPLAWLVFLPVCGYLVLSALDHGPESLFSTLPRHTFLALALWASGSVFWKLARRDARPGAGFLAGAFGLWGLQQVNYATDFAILDPASRYAEWVGFVDTAIVLFVALGMVRFALTEERSRLLESTHQLELSEQRLKDLAMRDPLTGLFNRRHFENVAPQIEAQAQRMEFPIAVLVIDLNRFKETNDEHGHQRGDQILRAFAAFLRTETRAADLPFRWGGDEFLVLMVDLAPPNVELKATQLRERWDGVRRELGSDITLAVGWDLLGSDGLEAAIRRADRRMYEHKRAGRNGTLTHSI